MQPFFDSHPSQAIHPGYGFLSENPKFADLVESAGLAFIGPSSAPMRAMGDKINSKLIAKQVIRQAGALGSLPHSFADLIRPE
jgi:propionyl-CoA carboxylase alpha chain